MRVERDFCIPSPFLLPVREHCLGPAVPSALGWQHSASSIQPCLPCWEAQHLICSFWVPGSLWKSGLEGHGLRNVVLSSDTQTTKGDENGILRPTPLQGLRRLSEAELQPRQGCRGNADRTWGTQGMKEGKEAKQRWNGSWSTIKIYA